MKALLSMAFLVGTLFSSSTVFAQAGADNYDTTIVTNGTISGRTFYSSNLCTTGTGGSSRYWASGTNGACVDGDPCTEDRTFGLDVGFTASCCRNRNIYCNAQGELLSESEIQANIEAADAEDKALEKVFNPDHTITYWGYYGSTNRSPGVGRTVAAIAKLDVCMGSTDVTNAMQTNSASVCASSYCGSSSINEYCNQTGANGQSVCADRCDCAINTASHSSCQGY